MTTFSDASTTDNCAATVAQTVGGVSGSAFGKGTTAVSFQSTDSSTNTADCSFNVVVTDAESPRITCPVGSLTANTATGVCTAPVSFTPTKSDNCPGETLSQTSGLTSGSSFPKGTTGISFSVTDAVSLTASCNFNVVVSDAEAPVVTCPANIARSTDSGMCTAAVTYSATATDNCGVASTVPSVASGSAFAVGSTSVTYTTTDTSGNTGTCGFSVAISDQANPTIVCPVDITQNTDSGVCGAAVTFNDAVGSDNCAVSVTKQSGANSGALFPVGTSSVVFLATDPSSNTAQCTLSVVVRDQTPPTISCPSNMNVSRDPGLCNATVSYTAPVGSDACSVSTALTGGLASGSVFPLGDTLVQYTATDASGNTASCSFTIMVLDDNNPQITCPSNINVNNDASMCAASVTYSSPSTFDCVISSLGSLTAIGSGNSFSVGSHTESFRVVNTNGISADCSFVVTVTDAEGPQIVCPANIATGTDAGFCYHTLSYTAPVGTDNCAGQTTVKQSGLGVGNPVNAGVTSTEVYTVTDAVGLTATCSFTVTVTDQQVPSITCGSNIVVTTDPGMCTAAVNYSTPGASDNCGTPTVALTGGLLSGANFPVGANTVEFTATDGMGLTATCSFTVTVNDAEAPVISCPSALTFPATSGQCQSPVVYTVTHTDNCAGSSQSRVSGPSNGNTMAVGADSVVYRAVDGAGNTASCSFGVTVTDTQAPLITCPTVPSHNNDLGQCSAVVTFSAPTTSDNCAGQTMALTSVKSSGSVFDVGTTSVSWTVTDGAGLQASCSVGVTVVDAEQPAISEFEEYFTIFSLCIPRPPPPPFLLFFFFFFFLLFPIFYLCIIYLYDGAYPYLSHRTSTLFLES